jgi:hypothetical protein
MESGAVGHNFEMRLPKDYSIVHCCFSLSQNELKFFTAAVWRGVV